MVRGKTTKPKTIARKRTGGPGTGRSSVIPPIPPPPRPPRRPRETARKSTGGLAPRYFPNYSNSLNHLNLNEDDDSEDDLEAELNDLRRDAIGIGWRGEIEAWGRTLQTLGTRSNFITSGAASSTDTGNGFDGGGDQDGIRLPVRQPSFDPIILRAESRRNMTGLNEAAVINAVAALRRSSPSRQNNTQDERTLSGNLIQQSDAVSAADSTNSPITHTSTCEPSSTSSGTPLVPPPAVPGHSRWVTSPDNLEIAETSSTAPTPSIPPIRRKKKHFTPLPFSESTPENLRRSLGSRENPVLIPESEINNSSRPFSFKSKSSSTIDAKKVKKAFANFQSMRKLLTDSGVCTHFDGFVHLNAVEQMLIKCYKYTKQTKNNSSSDPSQESANPPVIVLEDSNHSNENEAIITTNVRNVLFNPNGQDPVSPPPSTDVKLFNTNNVDKTTNNSPNLPTQPESNQSSSAEINLASSSNSASTASLTGGTSITNVARKMATVVPPPAPGLPTTATTPTHEIVSRQLSLSSTIGVTKRSTTKASTTTTGANGSSSKKLKMKIEHVDEAINAAIRVGSSPPTGGSGGIGGAGRSDDPPPRLVSDADLLAQMTDAQKETLNRLVLMGFGSNAGGQAFNQLLHIVRDNNGNLGACLDRLTR